MAIPGNPNHPLVQQAATHWHKFAALLLFKQGLVGIEITADDIQRFAASGHTTIVLDARGGRLLLRLVNDAEGDKLARQEGGLPA